MTQVKKAILISGTALLIIAFVNIATTINSSVSSFSGSSSVVSAFAG